jgi:hypothetical protein
MYYFAKCLQTSFGVAADLSLAVHHFRVAAQLGETKASETLQTFNVVDSPPGESEGSIDLPKSMCSDLAALIEGTELEQSMHSASIALGLAASEADDLLYQGAMALLQQVQSSQAARRP